MTPALSKRGLSRDIVSRMSGETAFTRDEHCSRCGKPVAVRCRVGKNATLSLTTETILCPWCGHNWTLEVPGQLLWVEKRL